MALTPEQKVQNKILSYFRQLKSEGKPIFYEKRQAGGFSYKKGLPDIYAVYNGQHIEIEIKAVNGTRSTMQEKYAYIFKSINCRYLCVDNVEDVISYMKKEFNF